MVNIKATNIELTPAITSYVAKKLQYTRKLVDLDSGKVTALLEVGKTTKHHRSGDIFRAEINLKVAGKQFRAVAKRDDLYAAIDEMKNILLAELKRDKEARITSVRKGGAKLKSMMRSLKE